MGMLTSSSGFNGSLLSLFKFKNSMIHEKDDDYLNESFDLFIDLKIFQFTTFLNMYLA